MPSSPDSLADLNRYLAFELTGHRQYLIHAAQCRHWGYERLARIQGDYSAEETRHAADLMARILLLHGVPTVSELGDCTGAGSVADMLARDHALVVAAHDHLRAAIERCETRHDFVSRDLLSTMLDDEEQHLHWLETELDLRAALGEENYLQAQLD